MVTSSLHIAPSAEFGASGGVGGASAEQGGASALSTAS